MIHYLGPSGSVTASDPQRSSCVGTPQSNSALSERLIFKEHSLGELPGGLSQTLNACVLCLLLYQVDVGSRVCRVLTPRLCADRFWKLCDWVQAAASRNLQLRTSVKGEKQALTSRAHAGDEAKSRTTYIYILHRTTTPGVKKLNL